MSWLLALALLASQPTSPAGQIIIIRMYVPPEVPAVFAADTRSVATRVLEQNGLSPVWIVCPPADARDHRCDLPIDPAEIVVRTLLDRTHYGIDRCGETYLRRAGGGQMITLFMDCSEAVARYAQLNAPLVHGHILVHEIGHLLLGPDHADEGIMQYPLNLHDWFTAACGKLNFTPDQVPALQRGAADRWSALPGTTVVAPHLR